MQKCRRHGQSFLVMGIVGVSLAACHPRPVASQLLDAKTQAAAGIVFPDFDSNEKPVEMTIEGDVVGGRPMRVYGLRSGSRVFLDGDILVKHENQKGASLAESYQRGVALTAKASLWPNGVVFYEIASDLPNQQRVHDAIAHWEAHTSIRFRPRVAESDYVQFFSGDGCYSSLGRIGGMQQISLANGCTTGATIHEIAHALGMFHEQSRNDRDQYLTIHFQNMSEQARYQFRKAGEDGGRDFGSFNFESIMLYGTHFFSSNGQPTITKKDGSLYKVNLNTLSAGDLATIKALYGNGTGPRPDPAPAPTPGPSPAPTPGPTPDPTPGPGSAGAPCQDPETNLFWSHGTRSTDGRVDDNGKFVITRECVNGTWVKPHDPVTQGQEKPCFDTETGLLWVHGTTSTNGQHDAQGKLIITRQCENGTWIPKSKGE